MEPILIVVILLAAWMAYDWIRNYLSKCTKCRGSGVLRATFFSRQFRPCPRCNRKGEVRHGFGPRK